MADEDQRVRGRLGPFESSAADPETRWRQTMER
jgi:hypothetical protein